MQTLLPAFVGGIAGMLYAYATLHEDGPRFRAFSGLYSAVGAAVGILGLRVVMLFRLMFRWTLVISE